MVGLNYRFLLTAFALEVLTSELMKNYMIVQNHISVFQYFFYVVIGTILLDNFTKNITVYAVKNWLVVSLFLIASRSNTFPVIAWSSLSVRWTSFIFGNAGFEPGSSANWSTHAHARNFNFSKYFTRVMMLEALFSSICLRSLAFLIYKLLQAINVTLMDKVLPTQVIHGENFPILHLPSQHLLLVVDFYMIIPLID